MKTFVSGATGYIGIQLVKRLAGTGDTVHALYRSEAKADPIRISGVTLFKGDILDESSLINAMEGCETGYHTAAFSGVWSRDPGLIYRLNIDGALHVINAARKCSLKRLVITSTAGILGPSDSVAVDETTPDPDSFFTPYEKSKYLMEKELSALKNSTPEIVIVNPTRVYGPGILSESNGLTKMIKQYMEGRWRFIPGDGRSSANYVFIEDVVTGHLLAMEKGNPGERYVLGGDHISYTQLFQHIKEASGVHKKLYKVPLWIMLATAEGMKVLSRISHRPPLIVPGLVRKFNHNWIVSSEKAVRELGYTPISVEEGIKQTVEWLNSSSIF